ncbi:MFS transporter [Chloroflexota bacterium]
MVSQEFQQFPGAKPKFFYGYAVAVGAFLIMLVSIGLSTAFGVFVIPLSTEFGWTRAMTSGAYSLSMIITGLLGIVMGGLTDKFGPRIVLTICGLFLTLGYLLMSQLCAIWQLYLFYGVIIGIGMAGSWVPLVSTVARWFVKRRSTMTGFVAAGMGIGGLIAPPVANQLISAYGWRMAYLILGIIVLIAIVSAAQLLRRDPMQKGLVPHGQNGSKEYASKLGTKSLSFKESVFTRQFWMLFAMVFCFGFCMFAIIVHIAPHATGLGFPPATAAIVLATIGGLSVFGNAVFGSTADRIGNRQTFAIGFILISAALFWLVWATELWNLYLFATIFGLATGSGNAIESPLVAEFFGLESHGLIYGVIALGFSIGASIGPFIAGYIFDVTRGYQVAFLVCAVVAIVGFILLSVLRPIKGVEVKT